MRKNTLLLPIAFAFATSTAHAEPPVDTVHLKDGGLLRGNVVESDPKAGVSIKLADGTIRKLPARQVTSVDFGQESPTPPVSSVAPVAATPPAAMPVYGSYAPGPPVYWASTPIALPPKRRSKGLFVTGLILMPLGAIALGIGVPYYLSASTSQTRSISTGCDQNHVCGYGSETFSDTDGQTIATALMVGGGVGLATGLLFAILGGRHVRANAATTKSAQLSFEPAPRGLAVRF